MGVSRPSWFKGKWPVRPRDEIASEVFEDLRKFIWLGSVSDAGRYRKAYWEDPDNFYNYDAKTWYEGWMASDPPNTIVDAGAIYRFYGEFFVLTVSTSRISLANNPPTNENQYPSFGDPPVNKPIVKHKDAVLNSWFERWACPCNYNHWDYDSNKWRVDHHGAGFGYTEYTCILAAHRWLPYDTKKKTHPLHPEGVGFNKLQITQLLETCWYRNSQPVYSCPSEISMIGGEPAMAGLDFQWAYCPYLSPILGFNEELEKGIGAYQNAVMFWSDVLGSYLYYGEVDDDYKIWWAKLMGSLYDAGYAYEKGQVVFAASDTNKSGPSYICILDLPYVGIPVTNTTYWKSPAYQPELFNSHPVYSNLNDDWFGCNSSGFEKMLTLYSKETPNEDPKYDWWLCKGADGNHPSLASRNLSGFMASPYYWPEASWRKMFRHTMGRPQKSNGDIEDWKIWPGEAGNPPGYAPYQHLISKSRYDNMAADVKYLFSVLPADGAIEAAWKALPEAKRTACLKRHDPVQTLTHTETVDGEVVETSVPQYELYADAMNAMWGVLSQWQYLKGDDYLTATPLRVVYEENRWMGWTIYDPDTGASFYPFSSPAAAGAEIKKLAPHPLLPDNWQSNTYYDWDVYAMIPVPDAASDGWLARMTFSGRVFAKCHTAHTSSNIDDDYEAGYWDIILMNEGSRYWYNDVQDNNQVVAFQPLVNDEDEANVYLDWHGYGYSYGIAWKSWPTWSIEGYMISGRYGSVHGYDAGWDSMHRFTQPALGLEVNYANFGVGGDFFPIKYQGGVRVRIGYRPMIRDKINWDMADNVITECCDWSVEGNTLHAEPVDTEAEAEALEKNKYLHFDLSDLDGKIIKGIVKSQWNFAHNFKDCPPGTTLWETNVYQMLELNLQQPGAHCYILLEMDWDKFAKVFPA